MTTLSQEQEQPHPSSSSSNQNQQTQLLLQRQRSSEQELLQPNHRPLLMKASTIQRQPSCQQQRPLLSHATSLGHHYHQPLQNQHHHHHHHHHSHPRLSQKNRQKLFSRSRGYKSVCSGSGSQHICASQSRCSKDHDEDIEACLPTKKGHGNLLKKQQPFHPWPEEPSSVISERCTRARINSAIFVSSEGRGFDSIEFIRRYGSQSVLCRKARSAENVSATERQRRFSAYPEWESEESKQHNNPMNGYTNFNSNSCNDPHQDSIELVECHREPNPTSYVSTSSNPKASSSSSDNANSRPTPKLSNLPTLSVSGPSPPHEEEFLL